MYSSFDETFSTIYGVLNENNISYRLLQGTKSTRDKIIRDFKNGSIKVLFLNSRKNGSGIDLPCTTDVILYHRMPLEIEEQCIGRGQRYGRKIPLNIHHFSE